MCRGHHNYGYDCQATGKIRLFTKVSVKILAGVCHTSDTSGFAFPSAAPLDGIEAHCPISSLSSEQLRKKLKSWGPPRPRVNVSSAELHHRADQQQAQPTSASRGLAPTNADSGHQHDNGATLVDHLDQSMNACHGKREREDTSECQPRQQNVNVHFGLPSVSDSNTRISLSNNLVQMQMIEMGRTDPILNPSSANLDGSKTFDLTQDSLEHQHLKGFMQYIREFKHDLHELPELAGAVFDDETTTWRPLEDDTSTNIEHDAETQLQNNRCCSEAGDEHADQNTGSTRPSCDPSLALMELEQPRTLDGHATQQQREWTSPGVFLPTRSCGSVSSAFISTHHRSRHCWPSPPHENEGIENVVPCPYVRRRPSMSSMSFGRITGMNSCPSETSGRRSDDVEGMSMSGDEAVEG